MSHDAAHLKKLPMLIGYAGVETLIGFDGFVDAIISVVDQRQSQDSFSRVATIADFSAALVLRLGKAAILSWWSNRPRSAATDPLWLWQWQKRVHPVVYAALVAVDAGSQQVHPVFQRLASPGGRSACDRPAGTNRCLRVP